MVTIKQRTVRLFYLILVLTVSSIAISSCKRQATPDNLHGRQKNTSEAESEYERVARWRSVAEKTVGETLTNGIVGFNRIINIYVMGYGADNPAKWEARAEAEFVNKVGGIERTNLRLKFAVYSGQLSARIEDKYERKERWRNEVPKLVSKEATNYLADFIKISSIDVSGDYSSFDPEKWQATAKVQFVNHNGITDYTNIPFKFEISSDYIFARDAFPTLTERLDADLAKIHRSHANSRQILDEAHDEALRRADAGTVNGPRTWTFQAGGKVTGSFVRFQGTNGIVINKTTDGREYLLPLNQLSEYDNDYIYLTQ